LYQATDAALDEESKMTISCTASGGSRIEVLTTSKFYWNPSITCTELYTTLLPKTWQDAQERAILLVAGFGSYIDWVPARRSLQIGVLSIVPSNTNGVQMGYKWSLILCINLINL
jgi:hypothetical protein